MKRLRLLGALSAVVGAFALLRRLTARSNTQVHRINQR
jgi:hypothetical protein